MRDDSFSILNAKTHVRSGKQTTIGNPKTNPEYIRNSSPANGIPPSPCGPTSFPMMRIHRYFLGGVWAFLTVTGAACNTRMSPPDRTKAPVMQDRSNSIPYPANALRQRRKEAGQSAAQQGNLLTVGKHRIRVDYRIENTAQWDGKYLVTIAVDVMLDGKRLPALGAGSIGIDTTYDTALETAADEWSNLVGRAFIQALFPRDTDPKPVSAAASRKIYHGPVGIRGTPTVGEFDGTLKQLSAALPSFVARAFPQGTDPEWHGLTIIVAGDPNRGISSMCRVDSKDSAALTEAVTKLRWPKGPTSYMFKQFYLVTPTTR
jgi:hypothetical protein